MVLSKDWREFLELLNSRGVDYVIVGAQSLAFHGRPRHTGDLHILVRASRHNARRLLTLLNQFGFEQSDFKETDFLLTSIGGVSTNEVFAGKISAILDGIPVFILGKDALIQNKRAVGRPQDLADLAALEEGRDS